MKKLGKSVMACLLACLLTMGSLCLTVSAEESGASKEDSAVSQTEENSETAEEREMRLEDSFVTNGQMNLDVVFVLDASGSMLKSDPNKVSLDAYSLFMDLLDETCGAGYVAFTHNIVESIEPVDMGDAKAVEKMKKQVTGLQYDPNGQTDISRALEKAKEMLTSDKLKKDGKKKVILLLTDGNTLVNQKDRSTAISKRELKNNLRDLSYLSIPVYSIGLNYDGKMNQKEVQEIAEATEGLAFEAKETSELLKIFSEIFGTIYDLQGKELELVDGKVNFSIDDSSVFSVSIIIKSTVPLEQMNPRVKDPDGKEVSLTGNQDVRVTSTNSYCMIKLFYPKDGEWEMTLDNVSAANCSVTQLDFYSIFVKQNINKEFRVGFPLTIEATIENGAGVVRDEDLLSVMKLTTVVTDGHESETVTLTRDGDRFVGTWTAKKAGGYYFKTHADAGRFKKTSTMHYAYSVYASDDELTNGQSDNDKGEDNSNQILMVLIVIAVAVVLVVAIIFIAVSIAKKKRREQEEKKQEPPAPPPEAPAPRPVPKAPPIETVKEEPKPVTFEFVDYKIVEHEDLEKLIKKGPEDAFHQKAEDYQSDVSLEALIKKGPDNAFAVGKDEESYDDDGDDEEDYEGELDEEYEDDEE